MAFNFNLNHNSDRVKPVKQYIRAFQSKTITSLIFYKKKKSIQGHFGQNLLKSLFFFIKNTVWVVYFTKQTIISLYMIIQRILIQLYVLLLPKLLQHHFAKYTNENYVNVCGLVAHNNKRIFYILQNKALFHYSFKKLSICDTAIQILVILESCPTSFLIS